MTMLAIGAAGRAPWLHARSWGDELRSGQLSASQDHLRALRQRTPKVIKQRLDRGVAAGELPREFDAAAAAAFYATVIHGLGVRAGDGASQVELMAVVDNAMAAWEKLTESPNMSAGAQPRLAAKTPPNCQAADKIQSSSAAINPPNPGESRPMAHLRRILSLIRDTLDERHDVRLLGAWRAERFARRGR